jgi:hypothetical protein
MVDFKIEATLDPGSVSAVFQKWATVADERDVMFVQPDQPMHASALVLLGAMAADRVRRGLRNRISEEPGANPLAWSLISLGTGITHGLQSGQTVERLQPISNLRAAREMADKTADAMTALAPSLSPSIVRMARFVFEELGANVVQHSESPETGYGYAKVDPARRRLELAFADAGIGFLASLQRNPELEGRVADDAEALQLALTPRISGTASPRMNMGIGLKMLTEFSDMLGGELWIASGSAMLHRRTAGGQRIHSIRAISPWRGSWICLEAPVA